MRPVSRITIVNLPAVDASIYRFDFNTTTPVGALGVEFVWSDRWHAWATLPDGSVRQFGCVPNVISWTGFTDYGVVIISDLTVIGHGDLVAGHVTLLFLEWA